MPCLISLMRKSGKTALKILRATIAELPVINQLITDCNQLLPNNS